MRFLLSILGFQIKYFPCFFLRTFSQIILNFSNIYIQKLLKNLHQDSIFFANQFLLRLHCRNLEKLIFCLVVNQLFKQPNKTYQPDMMNWTFLPVLSAVHYAPDFQTGQNCWNPYRFDSPSFVGKEITSFWVTIKSNICFVTIVEIDKLQII